jgi:hypothetical protein
MYCGEKENKQGVYVILNSNMGSDRKGTFVLPNHATHDICVFYSDNCLVNFLKARPEMAIACVPVEESNSDYNNDFGCAHCGKKEGQFIAVKGNRGSKFDCNMLPAYFCSIQCIINRVE